MGPGTARHDNDNKARGGDAKRSEAMIYKAVRDD